MFCLNVCLFSFLVVFWGFRFIFTSALSHPLKIMSKVGFREDTPIGHFHDGVILLQLPEFISFSFSNSNFVIPVDSKEQ